MPYDAEVSLTKGAKKPIFGTMTVDTGTLQINGTPTFTLYNSTGAIVTGYNGVNVTGATAGSATTVEAWYTLDTSDSNIAVGEYEGRLQIVATASSDNIQRTDFVAVKITIESAILISSTGYPTGSDIEAYIRSLSILNPATIDDAFDLMHLDRKAGAAIGNWTQRTGWLPFLSETQTRYYDPQGPFKDGWIRGGGRWLDFNAGLLDLTSLKIGVTNDQPGTELTQGVDFQLWPYQALQEGRPYERAEFLVHRWGWPHSITVEGTFGYSTTLPDDVWETILHEGARIAFAELHLQITRGLYSYRDLNTEIRYAGSSMGALSAVMKFWQNDFMQSARQYRRITF
jgi:hypothetical protein